MNIAEYGSRRSQQPKNVNFEPIIRRLKIDLFDRDQMYFLWICYETQLTNTKIKPSQTSQPSRARDGRGMGEVCLDKFLRSSSNRKAEDILP